MYIPCTEKCFNNIEGICKKDNCLCETGYVSGVNSCPFNKINSLQALKGRKHCV